MVWWLPELISFGQRHAARPVETALGSRYLITIVSGPTIAVSMGPDQGRAGPDFGKSPLADFDPVRRLIQCSCHTVA